MNWRERLADWISGGRLSNEITAAGILCWMHSQRSQEAQRYFDALDSIARNTCCDGCQEAARVAKKALQEAGR